MRARVTKPHGCRLADCKARHLRFRREKRKRARCTQHFLVPFRIASTLFIAKGGGCRNFYLPPNRALAATSAMTKRGDDYPNDCVLGIHLF